jgi:hypothetical protein
MLVGCDWSSPSTNSVTPKVAATYTLGGTVSGLNASGLVLANGTDQVTVMANATSFTLPTLVAYSSSYAVTVKTHWAARSAV